MVRTGLRKIWLLRMVVPETKRLVTAVSEGPSILRTAGVSDIRMIFEPFVAAVVCIGAKCAGGW
jgi:hypothetical protein